jgi:hypothetical protein
MIGVKPHHQSRGMPAAGNEAAVGALLCEFRVGVVRERDKPFAEADNILRFDSDPAEFVHRAGDIIFEISFLDWHTKVRAGHAFPYCDTAETVNLVLAVLGMADYRFHIFHIIYSPRRNG